MKHTYLIVAILGFLQFSCKGDDDSENKNRHPSNLSVKPCNMLNKIRINRDGAGDLHFDVLPANEESYKIASISYDWDETHTDLTFSSTDDRNSFNRLKKIFAGKCEEARYKKSKEPVPTGSDFEFVLFDKNNNTSKPDSLNVDGEREDLKFLENFVNKKIRKK